MSSNTAVSTITVNSLPVLSITGSTNTICNGSSLTLNASGAASYTWNTGPNGNSISVSPNLNTVYSVAGTSSLGCNSNNSGAGLFPVSVNPLPTVTAASGAICPNNSYVLNPSGAINYTFSSGSATVFPISTTTYSIIGSDANGCVSANAAIATVSVVNVLTITVAGNTVICLGNSTNLTAGGASTYTWSQGSTTNTLSVSPISLTTYTVIGASGTCSNTAFVSVNVNPLPILAIVSTASVICIGQSAILTASGASTYSWNVSQTTASIVVSPTLNSNYSVIGIDVNGCSNSASFSQKVDECTGITKSTNTTFGVNVYPNPNNGVFVIESDKRLNVIILNALGQIVVEQTLEIGNNKIEISNQKQGIYFVQLNDAGITKTIKIIKQ